MRKLGYGFLFAFHSNYSHIFSRFWDIQRQITVWPWNLGLGSFKVFENGTAQQTIFVFLLVSHRKLLYLVSFSSYLMLSNIVTLKWSLKIIWKGAISKLEYGVLLPSIQCGARQLFRTFISIINYVKLRVFFPNVKYVKIRYNSLKNSLSDVIALYRACCLLLPLVLLTLCFKKNLTTFSMISWTRTVCLQRFLAHILIRV